MVNLDPLLEGASFEELIKAQTDKALLVRFAIDCYRRSTDPHIPSIRIAEKWLLDPSEANEQAARFIAGGRIDVTPADVVYWEVNANAVLHMNIMHDPNEREWQLQRFMEIFCGS